MTPAPDTTGGGIAGFGVRNPVAVNLIMWGLVIAGIVAWGQLVREMFPPTEPEEIIVTVPYPGATPDEVEKSVALQLERELTGVSGVEQISSEILENVAALRLELEQGVDRDRVLSDVRNEVDRVEPDLPDGAEEPQITILRPFFPVISVVAHGDVAEERLREAAEDIRDDLVDLPGISEVTVSGTRDREIWVEIRPERLEEFGLTFEEVGRSLAALNLDLPGGQLEGSRGNVRVRTMGESERGRDLERLVVRADAEGATIRLGDIATVTETFEDKIEKGSFRGRRAVNITVLKTPEQDAIEIADTIKAWVAENPSRYGGAVTLSTTTDLSRFVTQRLELMIGNAQIGLILVCVALALFLDLRVAFWVAIGLPVSFLGTFVAMQLMGVTINLISLFGLIVVLGLIVDDAIVIGENVFTKIRKGIPVHRAAIEGTNEVGLPVLAAVLTTIVAFGPLAFLDGRLGTFLRQLPLVVIAALGVSLIEAFLILPAHLGHRRPRAAGAKPWRLPGVFAAVAARRDRLIEDILPALLERALRFTIRWRYVALSGVIALALVVAGTIAGGLVPFVLLQQVDAESVTVELEMAAGTPESLTEATLARVEQAVLEQEEVATTFSVVGTSFSQRGRESAADPATVGQVQIELRASDEREALGLRTSKDVIATLRARTGGMPGVSKLTYKERAGGPQGADVEIRVRADDTSTLETAVAHVRDVLGTFDGVEDIEDNLRRGKLEARVRLRDSARPLGLSTRDVAGQLRHALFGFEAQDLQQSDGEVTVRLILPAEARKSLADLGRLRIATPPGARVPLEEVADLTTSRGYASLARVNGQRAVTIRASVDEARGNVREITAALKSTLATLPDDIPGASVTFEGRQKQTRESLGSLKFGFPLALLLIYMLLASMFRSYAQPVMVMSIIPFALVGAVIGHIIAGYPLTLLSMIGGVALSGIVVNDSLILVSTVNRLRREGHLSAKDAVVMGSRSRMRAIFLTSLTTVAGLAPLMLETSFQAQFLIPMAISIVYGLVLATGLTLIVLPTFYVILEDLRGSVRWMTTGSFDPPDELY